MDSRSLLIVALTSISCVAHTESKANENSTNLHPNTAFQYWKDPCGYPPIIPTAYGTQLSRLLEAEALLIDSSQIEKRTDNPNYYRLNSTRPNINWANTTIPMGGDAPFLGETQLGTAGRSGYLIAPDIIVTAAHNGSFDPRNFVAVFDMRSKPQPGSNPLVCTPPDPEHIPASNVYYAKPINSLIANTITYYEPIYPHPLHWIDYAAYYLERSATDRRYLRIRKNGGASKRDNFAMAGHPNRLQTKLLYGLEYIGEGNDEWHPQISFPLFKDFYLWDGMSGAPAYNMTRDYVEISVGSPADGAGCTGDIEPNSIYNPNPFRYILDRCDDQPDPDTRKAGNQINAGPMSALANLVPAPYLRVSPLEDVDYITPINGSPSPSQTIYTATASSTESVNTVVSASLDAPPTGQPSLIQIGGYNSTLTPGSSTSISVAASIPTGVSCGIYDRWVNIADLTHGFKDRIRHRFEIGMTDFSVSPDDPTTVYAITAPSSPSNFSYTLTNTRPTPVTVTITLGQPWLSFDTGSANTVSLAAAGQAGATKIVIVKVNSNAYSLSNGDYPFTVSFQGQGSCALNSQIQRAGIFHKGVVHLKQTLNAMASPPTPANAPVTGTINQASSFCVTDVKARLNSQISGGSAGMHWADWSPRVRFYLDLSGAQNVTSQLWNQSPLPPNWNVPSYLAPDGTLIETLLLDRNQNVPPLGANSLSVFNNKNAAGQWTLRLFDDGGPVEFPGILESWELELRGSAFCIGGGG